MPRAAFWPPPGDRIKVYASVAALAVALLLAAVVLVALISFAWPSDAAGGPAPRIFAGDAERFRVGQPVAFSEGKFWVVKQPDGSFIALSWRSPYLGCTLPWRETFSFTDPRDGQTKQGWFRDPCHGGTWDINGVRVGGLAPRDMDRYPVEVVGGSVYVLTGASNLTRAHPDAPFWAR